MKESLYITLVQTTVEWEEVNSNLSHFRELLSKIQNPGDIIVLPETFPSGFSMNTERMAQEMNGPVVSWLTELSSELGVAICGSAIISENGKVFNRLLFVEPDGKITTYDKRHLFRMANEHQHFSNGSQKKVVEYKGWKINLQICYDLRFPVWSRNKFIGQSAEELQYAYDAMIYVANWPEPRISAWNTLLSARAIENQAFVVGVSRVGLDGNDVPYNGNSRVFDPKGYSMLNMQEKDGWETVELKAEELRSYRLKFPVGLDAD